MDNNIYKQPGSELFTEGSHSSKSIDKKYKIVMYILIIGNVYYLLKFSAEVYFTDDNIYTGFISFFDIFRPVLFAVDLLGLYWLIKYEIRGLVVLLITSLMYAGILLILFVPRVEAFLQLGYLVTVSFVVQSFVVPFMDVIVVGVLLTAIFA